MCLWTQSGRPCASTVARRGKEPAINTDPRSQQGDLILGLLNLLERNRLALVVLTASLTSARIKAREAYAESSPVRWLTRNARLVRHFLASLSRLRLCAGQAGYRALGRARPMRRLVAAPRSLFATATAQASLVVRVTRGPDRMRLVMLPTRL